MGGGITIEMSAGRVVGFASLTRRPDYKVNTYFVVLATHNSCTNPCRRKDFLPETAAQQTYETWLRFEKQPADDEGKLFRCCER